MERKRKKWRIWLNLIIIFYCLPGIVLYYMQDRFLFHPTVLDEGHAFHFTQPFEEHWIQLNSESKIDLIRFKPNDTSHTKGSIIYFHGNLDNVERYASLTKIFTEKGYDVWMPDYPGFGKSTGKLTEDKVYEMSEQVYKLVNSRISSDSITVYGKSLGSGFAAWLASTEPVKQLILETPYYSIPDLFNSYAPIYPTGWMAKYKVPTHNYLDDTKEPVTIFHGTDDGVIFYRRAKKLRENLKPTDKYYLIEGGKHNNLFDYPVYKNAIDSLLR